MKTSQKPAQGSTVIRVPPAAFDLANLLAVVLGGQERPVAPLSLGEVVARGLALLEADARRRGVHFPGEAPAKAKR